MPAKRLFVPVEIVRGVRLERRRDSRGSSWDVVLDLAPEGQASLIWLGEADARRVFDAVRTALGQ